MNRTFRWKMALVLAGCVVVGGLAVHATHAIQVRRHATAWLGQARQARDQEQTARALQYYSLYLTHQPSDHDARAKHGLLLDAAAKSLKARRQAADVLRNVLAHRPERHDVRARLVDTEMALGNYASARQHLALLLTAFPQSAAYEELQGRCLEAGGEFEMAAAAYERSLEHNPKVVAVYIRLATVLHERLEDAGAAKNALERMVAANETSVAARLARARFLVRLGENAAAHQDVTAARRLGRHNPEVLILAIQLVVPGDLSDLRHELQEALQVHPRQAGLYLALAQLECQASRHDEAEACLRRGVQALGNQPNLLHFLCELLVRRRALAEALTLTGTIRQAGDAIGGTYWEARILMVERRWLDAARTLETARTQPGALGMPQLELALAQCYSYMGNQEGRIEACRRAVTFSPAARLELAEALRAAGQSTDARMEYHQVIRQGQAPLEAWIGLARTLLARNQQLSSDRRSWTEIEDVLERAVALAPHALPVAILRSDILAAQGKYLEAAAVLEQARARDPEPPEVWLALAELAERQGRPVAALQTLTAGQRHVKTALPLHLARIRLISRRGGRIGPTVREMEKELGTLPPHEQSAARLALAEACRQSRELELAEHLATRAAELTPEDLRSRWLLLDLCLESDRQEKFQKVLAQVRAIEGDGGVSWRAAAAARCIRVGDSAALEEARKHLNVVQQRRSQWPRLHVLLGQLDERQGRADRACNSYLRAIELGERNPELCKRLLKQLHQRERDTEASYVVGVLEQSGTLDGAALVLAAENALAIKKIDRAVDWARRAASARPDAGAQVWLADILTKAGKADEAEKVLRSATQRWPDVPGVWAALGRHLAKENRALAEAVLREAKGDLVLAACHEAIGEPDRAAEHLRAATRQAPEDIDAQVQAAAFYLRQQRVSEARPHLERVVTGAAFPPVLAWARRELALVVAAGGADAQRQEAFRLLALNDDSDPAADQRARARILAAREATRAEAIRLLEASVGLQALPAEEGYLLAKLYRETGARVQARDQLARLAGGRAPQGRFVADYIDVLLEGKELAEAARWLTIMERLAPDSPSAAKLKHELIRLSSSLE